MARRDAALQATLAELGKVRGAPTATDSLALLKRVLAGKSSHAAAKAAEIAAEFEIDALVPDMVAAFHRLLVQPVRGDPGCAGKAAIANALYRIGAAEVDIYLKGIRHVQLEPVWGGKADTATALRGTCGLALVRVHYHDYLSELADLLADREAPARKMAAQALGYSENTGAVPLLRLKALVGDEDPQVLSECLLALLQIAADGAIAFVARFLERPEPQIAEAAALALGASRLRAALGVLTGWWERTFDVGLRRSALLAVATLKHDDAIAYLLGHIADSAPVHARDALNALGVFRHDARLRAQVEAVVQRRGDAGVTAAFAAAFT